VCVDKLQGVPFISTTVCVRLWMCLLFGPCNCYVKTSYTESGFRLVREKCSNFTFKISLKIGGNLILDAKFKKAKIKNTEYVFAVIYTVPAIREDYYKTFYRWGS